MTMRGLCLTLVLLATPAVVSAQGDGAIVVTKDAPAEPPTSQAWLVVDGHSQGLAGYDIDPAAHDKPQRVVVYRGIYGVNFSGAYSEPLTLRFRHFVGGIAFRNDFLPDSARYKIGDRITVFDVVMFDSALGCPAVGAPRHDPSAIPARRR